MISVSRPEPADRVRRVPDREGRRSCRARLGVEPLESRRLMADLTPGGAGSLLGADAGPPAPPAWLVTEDETTADRAGSRTVAHEVEPNGTPANAQALTAAPGLEMTGRLGPGDAMDMYRITVPTGARTLRLIMRMDAPATAPLRLTLMDGGGREMGNWTVDPGKGPVSLDMRPALPSTSPVILVAVGPAGREMVAQESYQLRIEAHGPAVRPGPIGRGPRPSTAGPARDEPPPGRDVMSVPAAAPVPNPTPATPGQGANTPGRPIGVNRAFPTVAPPPIGGILSLDDDPIPVGDPRPGMRSEGVLRGYAAGEDAVGAGQGAAPISLPKPTGWKTARWPRRDPDGVPPPDNRPRGPRRRIPTAADLPPIPELEEAAPVPEQGRARPAGAPLAETSGGPPEPEDGDRAARPFPARTGIVIATALAVGLLLPDLGIYRLTPASRRPGAAPRRRRCRLQRDGVGSEPRAGINPSGPRRGPAPGPGPGEPAR